MKGGLLSYYKWYKWYNSFRSNTHPQAKTWWEHQLPGISRDPVM